MEKPTLRPNNPNFSSGPCSKRPGWTLNALKGTPTGRSHRSKECKNKLNEAIVKSKKVLKLPDDYLLGIMPGSNTGALEAAMWCLLGGRGVDVMAWENFGKDEGGRHTPFMNNYRPQFYFRTTDVTGACELPEGTEMVMPGDNIKMVVSLIAPIAMDEGLKFAIREGGRTVGAGVVSKIVE